MFKISNSVNLINMLSFLKKRAIRRGLWYRALTNEERVLIDMISKYIKIVKNPKLAYVIAKIISKLLLVLKDTLVKTTMIINGLKRVESWSNSGKSYGWDTSSWFDANIVSWFGMFSMSFNFKV